jgi:DEAD/DEAH box helicase domain-containing protein
MMTLSSSGKKIIDTVSVDMPPYENTTTGMWIDVSKEALDVLGGDAAAAIHAAAHAFLNQFPMAGDLRTECPVPQKETMKKESSRKRPGRYVLRLERQAGGHLIQEQSCFLRPCREKHRCCRQGI